VNRRLAVFALSVVLVGLVGGCSTPAHHVPATYVVKHGDTLYSIAWRHGLDYREVARWNGIGRDYRIYPGQVLTLRANGRALAVPQSAGSHAGSGPGPSPRPAAFRWGWPTDDGDVALTERPNGGKGLTISGRLGQDVRAAGPGRVVYTGSGLLGYGQLVIIKHDETYLSAYGHTQSVAVHEGDVVGTGQRIATMGEGPGQRPMLYFEIRINGQPADPLTLLPARSGSRR
jgi:lipoprotein NlpD